MKEVTLVYACLDIINVYGLMSKESYSPLNVLQGKTIPPLGLFYLAAVLEKEGIKVDFINVSSLKGGVRTVAEVIKVTKPKIIGLYTSTFNLYLVSLLISLFREVSPESKIVIGGPHVHHCPDSVSYLDADFGFVSDGEYGFLKLTRELLNGGSRFEGIPNLIRKNNGEVIVNFIEKIKDLDSLPFPARHLWPYSQYFSPLVSGKTTAAITSRGCLHKCAFCATPFKGTLRNRSVKGVIDEFRLLEKQGFNYVELQDDGFTYDKERTKLICEELIRLKLKIKWICLTRVDCIDKELLFLMKKAKCTHIKYGIEFGSEFIRNKIMKKSISNVQIKETIINTKKTGIFTVGYFLLGAKDESLDDIKLTLRLAKELPLDYIDFNLMALIPGSEVFEDAVREGKITPKIWKDVAKGEDVPYSASHKVKIQDLVRLKDEIMWGHYFSPLFIFKEIFFHTRNLSSFINKAKILFNLLSLNICYNNFYRKFQKR